ncbi:hypothetical protein E4U25_003274 [Claviceps purpurea]|nr:hypothetical protein E4U25_003274 [Claviceps purpurea]
MAPANSKANYRTYEAQARMVRAIVAAHPEVKWNYKEIAACYGSDMSEHALNHRFRKIRAQSLVIKTGRERGFDMRDLCVDDNELPSTKEGVDKKNIAKYFGQSSADGIQFQFRAYKKDAETLRAVHTSGGDVANCLPLSSVTNTPSKSTPSRAAANTNIATNFSNISNPNFKPSSTSATNTPSRTPRKRPRIKRPSDDERDGGGDDDKADVDAEADFDEQDHPSIDQPDDWSDRDREAATPSRKPIKLPRSMSTATPRRQASAATVVQVGCNETPGYDNGGEAVPLPPHMVHGPPTPMSAVLDAGAHSHAAHLHSAGLTSFSLDPFMDPSLERSSYGHDDYGDGEI